MKARMFLTIFFALFVVSVEAQTIPEFKPGELQKIVADFQAMNADFENYYKKVTRINPQPEWAMVSDELITAPADSEDVAVSHSNALLVLRHTIISDGENSLQRVIFLNPAEAAPVSALIKYEVRMRYEFAPCEIRGGWIVDRGAQSIAERTQVRSSGIVRLKPGEHVQVVGWNVQLTYEYVATVFNVATLRSK